MMLMILMLLIVVLQLFHLFWDAPRCTIEARAQIPVRFLAVGQPLLEHGDLFLHLLAQRPHRNLHHLAQHLVLQHLIVRRRRLHLSRLRRRYGRLLGVRAGAASTRRGVPVGDFGGGRPRPYQVSLTLD